MQTNPKQTKKKAISALLGKVENKVSIDHSKKYNSRKFTNFILRTKGNWDPAPPKWASFPPLFFCFSLPVSNLAVGRNDWFSGEKKRWHFCFNLKVMTYQTLQRFQMYYRTTTFCNVDPLHIALTSFVLCCAFLWLGWGVCVWCVWFDFVTSAYLFILTERILIVSRVQPYSPLRPNCGGYMLSLFWKLCF